MANGNFGGGDGTELAPYLVEDGEDLKAIMTLEGSSGMHFVQVSNINLSNYKSEIYNLDVKSYSGGDFQISNLEIVETDIADTTGIDSLSLFNLSASNSSLLNVNLTDVLVDTSVENTASLLRARGSDVFVSNCHASGFVSSGSASSLVNGVTGGLVSKTSESCAFKDCSFSGTVSGSFSSTSSVTGGFVGRAGADNTFENCSSSGDVSGRGRCGGFVGNGDASGQLYRGCHAMCNVSGNGGVGGFAGRLGGLDTLVTSCRVDNGTSDLVGLKITGDDYVGGFVGWIDNDCTVRYVSSIVSGVTGTDYVGGFAGICLSSIVHDIECYGGYVFGSMNVGGFVGLAGNYKESPTLINIISRGVEIEGTSKVGGIAGTIGSAGAKASWCYVYYTRIIRRSGAATTFYDLCPNWDTVDQVEGGSGFVIEYLAFYDRA